MRCDTIQYETCDVAAATLPSGFDALIELTTPVCEGGF